MAEKHGGPAFPAFASGHVEAPQGSASKNLSFALSGGMSLRDYFAGQALIGMLSQPASSANLQVYEDTNTAARWAYGFADALIAERLAGTKDR